MTVSVTPDDLATYLGTAVDDDRAQMLIDDAVAQALSVVTVGTIPETGPTIVNLPDGADSLVRAAAARVYQNPTGVSQEVTGPYTFSRPAGSGSMYSQAEKAALRRLGGRSGPFSIIPGHTCRTDSSSSSSS